MVTKQRARSSQQIERAKIRLKQNIRSHTEQSIGILAESMASIGQLSPIGVAPSDEEGFFDLYFGAGRFAAAQQLGWSHIDATVFPRGSQPGESLRLAVSENTVRRQMNFLEQWEVINQYAQQTELSLQAAGQALGFEQPTISKIVKCHDRVTDKNKKRLVEAKVGFTVVYQISQADDPLQSELVDDVIKKGLTRKQIAEATKPVKEGKRKFEFEHDGKSLQVCISRTASVDAIHELLKVFAAELKRATSLNDNPAVVAQVLKGHRHAG